MAKTHKSDKKIIFLTSLLLFVVGFFSWAAIPFLKLKIEPVAQTALGPEKKDNMPAGKNVAGESCPAIQEQNQVQNKGALFIGCNGFF